MSSTSFRFLGGSALAGLVLGWLIRPLSRAFDFVAPTVSWLQVAGLGLTAAILVVIAWTTHQALRRHRTWLSAQQAVNRLVLAKACAITGALIGGGYLGYALTWLGDSAALADQRILRSVLAAVASAVMVVASVAIERACRIGEPDAEA